MTFGLREGVSFCAAGGRHFFLDRRANRYFALKARDEALFSRLVARSIEPQEGEALSQALGHLLSFGSQEALIPFALTEAPSCDLDCHGDGARLNLVLHALLSYALVKVQLACRAPARLFDAHARRKPGLSPQPQKDRMLQELGRAFERLRAWTGEDQCLPLSLSFARLAYGLGYPVTVIFAITPRPFGAHCWVQLGPQVLNDRLSRVEAFTPIYAI